MEPQSEEEPTFTDRAQREYAQIVAARIRQLRKKKGWNQFTLGAACHFESHAVISRYETGERLPSVVSLFRLAKALDCTPADLTHTFTGYKAMILERLREDIPTGVLEKAYVLIEGHAEQAHEV